MKRFLKEPLLHFLLLGAALFIAYGLISKRGASDAPQTIVVTTGQVEHLATAFAKTWQRPPSETDLEGLIDDWVREEIATREAKALGLDKDDTMIRRRLRQKLEFIQDDAAEQEPPTEAEMAAYLQAHRDLLGLEQRFSFRQVYLDPQKHGHHLATDASRLAIKLNRAGSTVHVSAEGDPFVLAQTFSQVSGSEVASQFGKDFEVQLAKLSPREWQPVESSFGMHLVSVAERTDADLPVMDEVRATARQELDNARRQAANERNYAQLLKRYTVIIEPVRTAALDKIRAGK
jgi:PPIC-type PPIASE domain